MRESIADQSLDFVGCYVGLHHMTVARLVPFLASIRRVLRPGGVFIVREHDVRDENLRAIVSLAQFAVTSIVSLVLFVHSSAMDA